MPSWDDDTPRDIVTPLIERCRELYDGWMKLKQQEVQLSLLDEDSTPSLEKS